MRDSLARRSHSLWVRKAHRASRMLMTLAIVALAFSLPSTPSLGANVLVARTPSVRLDASLSALTVAELKEKLQSAKLPVSGSKAELVARLEEYEGAEASGTTSVELKPPPRLDASELTEDERRRLQPLKSLWRKQVRQHAKSTLLADPSTLRARLRIPYESRVARSQPEGRDVGEGEERGWGDRKPQR